MRCEVNTKTASSCQELARNGIKMAQGLDQFCKPLRVGKSTSRSEYFTDEVGLIFRRRMNGEHQLVVPDSLADKVIVLIHDAETVGHPGRNRILDILCIRFYWPGMRRMVQAYVQKCHVCQQLKPRHEFETRLGDTIVEAYSQDNNE